MSQHFSVCIQSLGELLGFELSIDEGIVSIAIEGTWTLHLSAVGDDQVVIFGALQQTVNAEQALSLLKANLFNVEQATPNLGMGPDDKLIVWLQQSLVGLEASTLYQSLIVVLERIQHFESAIENAVEAFPESNREGGSDAADLVGALPV